MFERTSQQIYPAYVTRQIVDGTSDQTHPTAVYAAQEKDDRNLSSFLGYLLECLLLQAVCLVV